MDPYGAYFERDYVDGEEWYHRFNTDERVFTIVEFGTRETRDTQSGKTFPKPILHLKELGKPIFVNRTSHDALRHRFGEEYHNNRLVRGQLITISMRIKNAGGTRMHIVEVKPHAHPDQHAAIGEKNAHNLKSRLEGLELKIDDFKRWLAPREQKLWAYISNRETHEWPRGIVPHIMEYLKEQEGTQ